MDLYGGFEDDQYYESGRFNPDDYITSATSSSGDSGGAVRTLLNHPFTPLVLPCVTPRFVPTCTGEMLGSLGVIAAKYGLPVQSHLSESVGEVAWVKDLHPDCSNYASVYQKYGLLNEHCIMAHCCHSDAAERQLLAECNTAIVHCASSNFCLDSGVLDVHGCVAQGIRVGMGTDVAGGYSSSMLDALRQSIIASKVIMFEARGDLRSQAPSVTAAVPETVTAVAASGVSEMEVCLKESSSTSSTTNEETGVESDTSATFNAAVSADPVSSDTAIETAAAVKPVPVNKVRPLNYKEAFHLATVGGAEALGMGQVVGNFLPGKKLDCLVVDPAVPHGPFDLFDGEGVSEFFQKFLFLGDDRNIVKVFVDGRQVI
jgi:cytosine/adenosine deaminase-related metal-dependent hydrolase